MDDDTVLSNLSAVKEMILDEEKPVTYVSLSKDLCLHVNTAKKILEVTVDDIKTKDPKTLLNVSYIISGLKDGNNAMTKICSEAELLDEKKSFKCVFFCHIYAVSIGKPSVDRGVYMIINRFEDFSLCQGLIKNISCAKRSSDEIVSLKSNSQNTVPQETKINPQIKVKVEKKEVNGINDEPVAKLQGSKSESSVKLDMSPKKDTSNNKKSSSKNSKGIAGFFTKSNSAPQPKVTPTPKETTLVDTNKNTKSEKDIKVEKMETEDIDIKLEKVTPNGKEKKEPKQNGKSSSKKLDKIKKTAKVDKKRKRLLHVSDSESDDEESPFASDSVTKQAEGVMDYDSEDEIPPTPTVNTVKITSGIVNPKKRRKIVDKTYTDDEGYILTKKVEVYESCSENEDDASSKENKATEISKENKVVEIKTEVSPKEKKQAPKAGKKKISPPQKGKQVTLTSFFKKV